MQTSRVEPRPWAPIPGPVDRTSFFEEQARHRRSTWRLSALCLLTVAGMGLVVSCIVGPLVLLQVTFMSEVLGIFLPFFKGFSRALGGYFDLIQPAVQGLPVGPVRLALGWAVILLPGIAALGLIWLVLQAFFPRDGVGGVLLSLGARAPRADDLEEQQLVNVVAEMAIAAGLRPPRVVLLDSDVPNAAAVGVSPDDATVVVSRRLLDEFDRDQTQAVLGHLIGSIGNGDLRIAFSIASVYGTFGLLLTLLDTPFSATARSTVLRVLHYALRPPGRVADSEAEAVAALLGQTVKEGRLDEIGRFIEPGPNSRLGRLDQRTVVFRGIRAMLFMPLLFANLFGKIVLMLFLPLLIGPLIALVWRSRRYLADSTAVQLTRNPDGLAAALGELIEKGGLPPGGGWAAHLFVVGTEVGQARARRQFLKEIEQLGRGQAGQPVSERLATNLGTVLVATQRHDQASTAAEQGTFAEQNSILVNFHPPLEKRLKRLRAQGATVTD